MKEKEEKMTLKDCFKNNWIKKKFVGLVISDMNNHTTSQEFRIGFDMTTDIELGEVIGVVDATRKSIIYGIVNEICMFEDVPDYVQKMMECNWDFNQGERPIRRNVLAFAQVGLLRRFSEDARYDYALIGITPNLPVYKVSNEGLLQAFDLKATGIPLGIYALSSGQTVDNAIINVDPEFLLGKEAAHVNISGQSGFGKSAYMLYMLKALYEKLPGKRIKTLILNVKEDDLLWLDKTNTELDDNDLSLYKMLGVSPKPFNNVIFYATDVYNDVKKDFTSASLRNDVKKFYWNWEEIQAHVLLAISPDEDWDDKQFQCLNITRNQHFKSFTAAKDYAVKKSIDRTNQVPHYSSWGKFARILNGIELANKGLLRQDTPIPYEKVFAENDILVVDINEAFFPPHTQRLVFGKIVEDLQRLHQQKKLNADYLIIITDELSRYASKFSDSHLKKIKEMIKGIAARGRSIATPLIGLEQFPSEIDEQILGNINTKIFSRTKQSELKNQLYAQYSKRVRFEMLNLKKGYVFAENSQFADLIKVRYPRPPCAQKKPEGIDDSTQKNEPEKPKKDEASRTALDDMDALL
ncbi:MAG: ATP-binding protein [Candidatus Hodarchaeota archaeon]